MKSSPLCSSLDCWFPTKWAVLIGSLGSNKLAHLSVEKRGLLLSYNAQSTWKNSLGFFCLFFKKLHQSKTSKLLISLCYRYKLSFNSLIGSMMTGFYLLKAEVKSCSSTCRGDTCQNQVAPLPQPVSKLYLIIQTGNVSTHRLQPIVIIVTGLFCFLLF